ncbi:MAG: hypothetical protein IMY67_03195 [Bacteroidetes bacterium]|nr:hypothetical protein [Bacteroidota bacterium]
MEKENIEDWKPYALVFGKNAYDKYGNRNKVYYNRSWMCQETGNIHHSKKSVLNCVDCSNKYYKPEPNNKRTM